jgi:hypothetical protein
MAFLVFFSGRRYYCHLFLPIPLSLPGRDNIEEAAMPNSKRPQVRAENPSGACGKLDHMTVDELKARAVGDEFDGTCPACGKFHLTRAEIDKIEREKVIDSETFKNIQAEAIASS